MTWLRQNPPQPPPAPVHYCTPPTDAGWVAAARGDLWMCDHCDAVWIAGTKRGQTNRVWRRVYVRAAWYRGKYLSSGPFERFERAKTRVDRLEDVVSRHGRG